MITRFLLSVAILAIGVPSWAQLNNMEGHPEWSMPTSSGLETDKPQIAGCLSKDASGDGFLLTNQKYKEGIPVIPSKSKVDLTAELGHAVELTGVWKKNSVAGADPKSAEMRTFNVSKIRKLAGKCVPVKGDPNQQGVDVMRIP